MKLSAATPADLPDLHALIESAYRGDSARAGWSHEADLLDGQRTDLEALTAALDDAAQQLLVFREGERITACVSLTDRGDRLTYLGLLTVEPRRQATGLGRMMLAAAEDHAVGDCNANRIEMTVIAQRIELVAWYQRRGYALTGERRPFQFDESRFGKPRRDALEFVVLEKALPG